MLVTHQLQFLKEATSILCLKEVSKNASCIVKHNSLIPAKNSSHTYALPTDLVDIDCFCFTRDPVLAKARFQIYQILMFSPWSVFRILLTIVLLKLMM